MICRVCDRTDLREVIDLGPQPWGNHFLRLEEVGTEPFYPLRLVHCAKCKTAQLDFTVQKETLFGDHTYLSGITQTMSQHFGRVAVDVSERFDGTSVLDIGSNDGTLLKQYQNLGYSVLGVESSESTAIIAAGAGIPTINDFFSLELAHSLNEKFDIISAANVFAHLEDLHSVTEGIHECLKDDGVFVVQFLYMKQIVENLAFDQIYHEHLLYYNLETVQRLLARHGLEMFDAYLSPIHGGSIVGFVGHAGQRPHFVRFDRMRVDEEASGCNEFDAYRNFKRDVALKKAVSLTVLNSHRRQGKRVFGFGAPVKGNTLLNYFDIGADLLECLVEKNPLRKGLISPGMHIPIVMEDTIQPPDVYYVLAWNFKEEILRNNRDLIAKGVSFYFPVTTSQQELSYVHN